MLYELYTQEKLRELEVEARAQTPGMTVALGRPALVARMLRPAGRLLRRLGAGLEDWGESKSPASDCCEACG